MKKSMTFSRTSEPLNKMNQPCYNEQDYLTLRQIAEALGIKLSTVRAAASEALSRACFATITRRNEHGRPYKVAKLCDARAHFNKRRKE